MQIAQLNIAKAKSALDSPLMKEFVDNLESVNTTAEASPGFVWRYQDDSGIATNIELFDDPLVVVNLSVWQSIEMLKTFVFKTHHLHFLKRKAEWFEKMEPDNHVLWWLENEHLPSLVEAHQKLTHLRENGASSYAFNFKKIHQPEIK